MEELRELFGQEAAKLAPFVECQAPRGRCWNSEKKTTKTKQNHAPKEAKLGRLFFFTWEKREKMTEPLSCSFFVEPQRFENTRFL